MNALYDAPIDANGQQSGTTYSLMPQSPGPFRISLIVTRSDGTEVGTSRVVQLVE